MTAMNYACELGYTDRYAYEIVNRVSDKTLEVRRLKATRDPAFEPVFIPGGFSAHCVNQSEQKWTFESDEQAPVIRIRKKKYYDYWTHKGHKFVLTEAPREFYDYNF